MKINRSTLLLMLFGLVFISISGCGDEDKNEDDIEIFLIDFENNSYKTVRICDQVWMAENLRSTILNDGDPLPNIKGNKEWAESDLPAYCYYNLDKDSLGGIFGPLYNWYAVSTGKLCPKGWHVPTESDWQELVDCLGGKDVAGGKLKEIGTAHWQDPNKASDAFGFSILPTGFRGAGSGLFDGLGYVGCPWSSTESIPGIQSWASTLINDSTFLKKSQNQIRTGNCVRCIKD